MRELDLCILLFVNGYFDELTVEEAYMLGDYMYEMRSREKGTGEIIIDMNILGGNISQHF